jgi:hypothetical protein
MRYVRNIFVDQFARTEGLSLYSLDPCPKWLDNINPFTKIADHEVSFIAESLL